jgi:hypothetical protein
VDTFGDSTMMRSKKRVTDAGHLLMRALMEGGLDNFNLVLQLTPEQVGLDDG